MENYILDEGQLGAVDGVLGTVDQLIIDYNGRSEDMSLKSDCSILMTTRKYMIESTMTGCSEYISRLEYPEM